MVAVTRLALPRRIACQPPRPEQELAHRLIRRRPRAQLFAAHRADRPMHLVATVRKPGARGEPESEVERERPRVEVGLAGRGQCATLGPPPPPGRTLRQAKARVRLLITAFRRGRPQGAPQGGARARLERSLRLLVSSADSQIHPDAQAANEPRGRRSIALGASWSWTSCA